LTAKYLCLDASLVTPPNALAVHLDIIWLTTTAPFAAWLSIPAVSVHISTVT
jgi:hypothetical protein